MLLIHDQQFIHIHVYSALNAFTVFYIRSLCLTLFLYFMDFVAIVNRFFPPLLLFNYFACSRQTFQFIQSQFFSQLIFIPFVSASIHSFVCRISAFFVTSLCFELLQFLSSRSTSFFFFLTSAPRKAPYGCQLDTSPAVCFGSATHGRIWTLASAPPRALALAGALSHWGCQQQSPQVRLCHHQLEILEIV